MARHFVLLDRDGTVVVHKPYLAKPADVELIAGVADGMRRLLSLGFGLVVVTNQSGIGRGYFSLEQLQQTNQRMVELLEEIHVRLDGIYWCPHHPDEGCNCRKPRPGMLQDAARELDFELSECHVIGNAACDIGAGQAVGGATYLVSGPDGHEADAIKLGPDHVVANVDQAAHVIKRLAQA